MPNGRHGAALHACLISTLVLSAAMPRQAVAVELIQKLDCALTQTSQANGHYCLKVVNTCNTPIISRIEESGGTTKDSPEIRSGDRDQVCSKVPFVFLGHYIAGPLAEGAPGY